MYPSGESSNEGLLPAGPSTGTQQLTTPDVDLEDIVVDNPSNDPRESTLSVSVPKRKIRRCFEPFFLKLKSLFARIARPLNLADNYEIVEGVPTFVSRPSPHYKRNVRLYSISPDHTRIAIIEDWHKIGYGLINTLGSYRVMCSVYDMLHNFSLVERWEDKRYEKLQGLTFHTNENNMLLVVFWDSTVALLSLSHESKDGTEQTNASRLQIGVLEIQKEFRILDKYHDTEELRFGIFNHNAETWLTCWDVNVRNIVALCSIQQEEFRRMQIKSNMGIVPTFTYASISQKALMLVTTYAKGRLPLSTRIWHDLDFTKEVNTNSPIEISGGRSFGFSPCGSYILIWKYDESRRNAIEIYTLEELRTSLNPKARRSIGTDVKTVRGQFVQRDRYSRESLGFTNQDESPIIAYVVAFSKKMKLSFWDISCDRILKEMDLTMKELSFSNQIHIEFCISPNAKWVIFGCLNDGIFGLFSLSPELLVWRIRLNTSKILGFPFTPLDFDVSSTKLILNASDTFYVFTPPCLLENYFLKFESICLNLVQNSGDSRVPLSISEQVLLPEHIIKKALLLQHGLESLPYVEVLDVANSRMTSNVALLIQRNKGFKIVRGVLSTLFASTFTKYVESDWSRDAVPNGIVELSVATPSLQQYQFFSNQQIAWIFLHPNKDRDADSIAAVFLSQDGLLGVFIDDIGARNQDQVLFGNQECFALEQSKDGFRVVCLHTSGVMTIDLKERCIICHVSYRADLAQWLLPHIATRNQSCFEVSHDATSILIGWDTKNEKLMFLTSHMDDEECRTIFVENDDIVPCWRVSEGSKTFAFLEFNGENQAISSISTYSAKSTRKEQIVTIYFVFLQGNDLKRITREQWNHHTRRILDSLVQGGLHEYTLQLNESNGHLWIIALQGIDDNYKLILTPLSPYSVDGCTPSLYMQDYPTRNIDELEELVLNHGHAFFNILCNGKDNIRVALDNKDKVMLNNLVELANQYGISSQELILQSLGGQTFHLMTNAIKEQNEVGVAFLLDLIGTKTFPFEDEAMMLKKGFEGLWLEYRALLESKILNKTLEWMICEFEIPIDIFNKDANVGTRVGTSDSLSEWQEAYNQGNACQYWKSLHKEDLKEVERRWSNTTTTSIVVFFTIANVCKIGLNGIIRFLLMQDASSYIFKAPLLKWVIAFKWEKVWKKRSLRSFVFYACFIGLYSVYGIWIAFSGKDLYKDVATSVCLTILLFVLMAIASMLLYQEYLQMRSCIQDGKRLFPNDRTWGVRKYCSSMWNLVEVLTYLTLILVIPFLHFANLDGIHVLPFLYTLVAFEALLVWIKVWFYAQAFESTAGSVMIVEHIITECIPFLRVAIAILGGFSLALFVLFQYSLQEKRVLIDDGKEDEAKTDVDRCFGDPLKAMLTLFYAMIGTFEPKVYYHSGSLSPIITFTFVVYLTIQMILVVNMLIAILGDTFDRVKSTEEELLLKGRAMVIDACESQLNEKEIEEIENSVGKYLYVLLPKDGDVTEDSRVWQGRVKTIEESVGRMIRDSQGSIMKRLEKDNEEMKGKVNEIMKIMKIKEDTKDLKQMNQDIDDMKGNLNEIMKIKEDTQDLKQMNQDMDEMKEDMAGIKNDVVDIKGDMVGIKNDVVDMKEVLQLIKEKVLE